MIRNTKRHRHVPQVEALESLLPLSSTAGAIAAASASREPAAIHEGVRASAAIALQGRLQGTYTLRGGDPATGATYQVATNGRLAPLGRTTGTGQIRTPGLATPGQVDGTLRIKAPRGVVTLQVTSPVQSGFTSLSGTLAYTITGGTRAYLDATGSGSIDVAVRPGPGAGSRGTVTLIFSS